LEVDAAIMTGNVAQVFTTDESWMQTLVGAHGALSPGGHLVFETRDPAKQAWLGWNPEATFRVLELEGGGTVETWHEVTDVQLPLVTFETTFRFGDETLLSTSTLRFRDAAEIRSTLNDAGFEVVEVRDAPDRPGREFVFIAGASDPLATHR
jgi:hypothetical protein